MAYGDFIGLPRGITSDKILHDKVFNIAKNSKYDRYQRGLVSVVYKFFDKKTSVGVFKSKIILIFFSLAECIFLEMVVLKI